MGYPLNPSSFYTPLSWGGNAPPLTNYAAFPGVLETPAPVALPSTGNDPTQNLFGMNWGVDLTGSPALQPTFLDQLGGFFKGAIGTKDAPGWGGMALGAAGGLASAFMGMQQYGLQKDILAASKEQFAKNYAAQQKMTNSRLEDRQRARLASNPGAYQSVGDYMKQYGV